MKRTSFEHFSSLWQRLGAKGDAAPAYNRLIEAYGERDRAYHSIQHLEECLLLLDLGKPAGTMNHPDAIEMALWLHDAVYDPKAADNEEQSAALARSVLQGAGVAETLVEEIEYLVLVTKTHQACRDDDSASMVDIDLAILGQPQARFLQYEEQIWQEYSWVPRPVYQQKRAEVLQRFLDRSPLFLTAFFHERLESAAKANLGIAIHRLRIEAA